MDIIKVCCITWNVETGWPEEPLMELLGLESNSKKKNPDVFVICLQEVRSQPQNVIMDTLFEEPWTTAFREVLGLFDYVRVAGERLQGILTSIFVKRQHLVHIRDIHTSVTRTGLGGFWMSTSFSLHHSYLELMEVAYDCMKNGSWLRSDPRGNKGSVSVRFSLHGCSICTVNAHLAAHDKGYEERCSNYNTIIDETSFPITPTSNILYHDYVFWLGDLNFRLVDEKPSEELVKTILVGDFESLVKLDELKKAQISGDAFSPLTEGPLLFSPTYKFHSHSVSYDLTRRPAWTDRILHQVHVDAYENVKLGLEQTKYSSHPKYGQSDHKPVSANYDIKVFARKERCVTFKPVGEWYIGCINRVLYSLDADVEISPWDYIAIFKVDPLLSPTSSEAILTAHSQVTEQILNIRANFTSVHQYVTYAYLPQSFHPPEASSISSQNVDVSERNLQLLFSDELVQTPGLYVLLYYSGKYNCFLGMSDHFIAVEKQD